jgi:hypothetical protein
VKSRVSVRVKWWTTAVSRAVATAERSCRPRPSMSLVTRSQPSPSSVRCAVPKECLRRVGHVSARAVKTREKVM